MALDVDEPTHIPFEFTTIKRTATQVDSFDALVAAPGDCYYVEHPGFEVAVPPPDATAGFDPSSTISGIFGLKFNYSHFILKNSERFIAKLHNVEIDKMSNFHFLDRNLAISDVCHPSTIRSYWHPHKVNVAAKDKKFEFHARKTPKSQRIVEEDVLSLGFYWVDNYWHFLIEALPKFRVLAEHKYFKDMPIIWHAHENPFVDELLKIFGLQHRLLKVDHDVLLCRRLFMPSLYAPNGMSRDLVDWLRHEMLNRFNVVPKPGPERLFYVSRRDAGSRKIINEEDLFAALMPLGFELIVPGEMTVAQQVEKFAETRMFVGPHGAALANTVYCHDGIGVVDIQPANRAHPATFSLAKIKGHSYGAFLCHEFDDVGMTVDVPSVVAMVKTLMEQVNIRWPSKISTTPR